jgi:hypothetical protein
VSTMTPNQKQTAPAAPDDPMVISAVYFRDPVPIGGHGVEEWTLQGVSQNQYHGRSRVQEQPYGVLVVYKSGAHYEEIKVPWGNLRSVTSIPLSKLNEQNRATFERTQTEIRR